MKNIKRLFILMSVVFTMVFSENYVFPISKTEFVVQNKDGEKIVDMYGKDFIVISLREPYADGRIYGVSGEGIPWLTGVISSGASGHRTPAGVFNILYRKEFHMSTLYPDASGINNMDYSLYFLPGYALHKGNVNAESHGCIHVATNDIKTLWDWTKNNNVTIIIMRDSYIDFVREELLYGRIRQDLSVF